MSYKAPERTKSLEGDLGEFPLTDIIQLVDLSKKTGAAHLIGRRGVQELEGWLYFRDGRIIGAELLDKEPLEAVYTFFTFTSGPFEVYDGIELDHPTISVSNEVIIMEGIMRQDAWSNIEAHVPSLDMVPRLIPNPSSGTTEINLEAEEWRVLTMVNGKNTVSAIAQRSGLGEFRTCEIIAQLLTSGLIEEREVQSAEKIFPELERIVADVVGSNAQALVQDACDRANITNPVTATSGQIFAAINHLEQSMSALVDHSRVRQAVRAMQQRAAELFD